MLIEIINIVSQNASIWAIHRQAMPNPIPKEQDVPAGENSRETQNLKCLACVERKFNVNVLFVKYFSRHLADFICRIVRLRGYFCRFPKYKCVCYGVRVSEKGTYVREGVGQKSAVISRCVALLIRITRSVKNGEYSSVARVSMRIIYFSIVSYHESEISTSIGAT